jgi:putative membrane protein
MRRMGYVTVVLMTAVTIGCNRDDRTAPVANSGGEPSAVATSGTDRGKVSNADQDFINDAAVANIAEIELGSVATERAANPDVKRFGQMMLDDHTKAVDTLKAMAAQHSIAVPSGLDNKHSELVEKLSKLNGNDFDRAYMEAMVDGHQAFVDKLGGRVHSEAAAVVPEKSNDPITMSVNQWAADTYPVASEHLTSAKAINSALKVRTTN